MVFYSEKKPSHIAKEMLVYNENTEPKGWYIKRPINVTEQEFNEISRCYKNSYKNKSVDTRKEIILAANGICVLSIILLVAIAFILFCIQPNILILIAVAPAIILVLLYRKIMEGFGSLISIVLQINRKL